MPVLARHVMPFVVCFAAHGLAQAPSPWVDLHVPGGVLSAGLSGSDKLTVYRNGPSLHVFSAVTRRWLPMALSAGTTHVVAKDMLLVPESDRWTAFSAYRGNFAVQLVPFASSTMQHFDSVACVTNGNTVHAYSAFTGTWATRTIQAGWQVLVAERVALVHSPATAANLQASAFDAYTGAWYDLPAQPLPLQVARVSGTAAVVATAAQQFGFSAPHAAWSAAPVLASPPYPTVTMPALIGELVPGLDAVFSSVSGTWAPSPLSPSVGSFSVLLDAAIATDGTNHFATGSAQNVWVPIASGTVFGTTLGVALTGSVGQVNAFSGQLGSVASAPWQPGGWPSVQVGLHVAAIYNQPAATNPVFSWYTGQWYSPPPGTILACGWTAENSALFRMTGGVVGFAAPTGTFVPQTGIGLFQRSGFCATNSSTVYVFDPHGRRWHSAPLQGAGALMPLFRGHTMVGWDAVNAVAWSERGRQLAVLALPEPVQIGAGIGEDIATVRTATHVFAFAGFGDSMWWHDAVNSTSGVGPGMTAVLQARVPAGHLVALGFGQALPAPVSLPFGELWLDLATTVTLVLSAAPGESRAVLPVAIPPAPALHGSTWTQQTFTLAPNGAAWLGAPSTLFVL